MLLRVLEAFGLAYVVGHSQISLPFRRALWPGDAYLATVTKTLAEKRTWGVALAAVLAGAQAYIVNLLECPACFGFWEGIGFGLVRRSTARETISFGLLFCATNFLLANVTRIYPPPPK